MNPDHSNKIAEGIALHAVVLVVWLLVWLYYSTTVMAQNERLIKALEAHTSQKTQLGSTGEE